MDECGQAVIDSADDYDISSDVLLELVESFINGNRSDVAKQILRMRPLRKACTMATAVSLALTGRDRLTLLRLLSSVNPKDG